MAKKKQKNWTKDLSRHLFWDVDKSKMNPDKKPGWLIQRVLEYGLLKDWIVVRDHYGLDVIAREAIQFRCLDDVSISFISSILKIKKENFRCYKLRQSNPHFWNY